MVAIAIAETGMVRESLSLGSHPARIDDTTADRAAYESDPTPDPAPEDKALRARLEELGQPGRAGKDDLAFLVNALSSPDAECVWRADYAIGRMGAAAAHGLAEILAAGSTVKQRRNAAYGLAVLGKDAATALDALHNRVTDPDLLTRCRVVQTLGEIGGTAPDRVGADLVRALKDRETAVRRVALIAVGKVGRPLAAALIVPLITLLAEDPQPVIRSLAAQVVPAMGAEAHHAAPTLVQGLQDPDSQVRLDCAEALFRLGENAMPALLLGLEDPKTDGVIACAAILGRLGRTAKHASDPLHILLRHPDPLVRRAVGNALQRIENP